MVKEFAPIAIDEVVVILANPSQICKTIGFCSSVKLGVSESKADVNISQTTTYTYINLMQFIG